MKKWMLRMQRVPRVATGETKEFLLQEDAKYKKGE